MGRENVKQLQQIVIFRGDTAQCVIPLRNDADTGARDLTGNTYQVTINRERNPANVNNQIMAPTTAIVGTPTDGNVGFTPIVGDYSTLTDDEFLELASGDKAVTAWYDVAEIDGGGGILTVGKGVCVIVQDIGK